MPDIAIVILNFNGKAFLERYLPLVIRHSKGLAEVFVADNASKDNSVVFLKEHFPEVKIIQNPRNEGFSTGYNLALKQIKADYYVLLNSDIEVTANWISPVIALMEKDPQVAACQPKIRAMHAPGHFEYAGAGGGYIDKFGYPFCRGRKLKRIRGNMMRPLKCFGLAEPACLCVLSCFINLVALMIVFLHIWRKLIFAGA